MLVDVVLRAIVGDARYLGLQHTSVSERDADVSPVAQGGPR